MSNRTVEIIIDLKDNATGKTKALAEDLLRIDRQAQRLHARFQAFANSKYNATLSLIDRVTSPASRINNLLKRLAGGAYRITLSLNDGVLNKIRQVEGAVAKLAARAVNIPINVGGIGSKMSGMLSGAAMGAGFFMPMAGMAGIGFGIGNAIEAYAGFEKQMSRVQALRQLDKDSAEMHALVQQAKDLGKTTAWTRTQVGEAQEYAALAGWSTPQILAATPHMLNLASAAKMDLGRTSDVVTDTLTAFGLRPDETYINKQGNRRGVVEGYIDMLNALQTNSNTTIEQAYGALKYSANAIAPMFHDASAEVRMQIAQDVLTATGLMANAGIKDSQAGTSLRGFITRLASGNRNAWMSSRGLGVDFTDENGNFLMLGEVIQNFQKRFKEGMPVEDLLSFAEEINGEKIHADTRRKVEGFIENALKNGGKMGTADMAKMGAMLAGVEGMSGTLAMLMGDWIKLDDALSNADGSAKKTADTMIDNLAGSFVILGSAWDNFQQNLMEGGAGAGLKNFVDALTEMINRADDLFKDGVQIADIGKIFFDAVGRLKNKFLELDGLGSLLAGGALFAGLNKFVKVIREIGKKGSSTNSLPTYSPANLMNVTANIVNINGRIAGGKVGNTSIIDNYNRTKERIRGTPPPPPAPSLFSNVKSSAGYAAAFAGFFSLMDIFSTRALNAERLAQAPESARAEIIKENRKSEWEASVGGLASVVGAAIGAGFGSVAGPMGTMIGGMVGATVGEILGVKVGDIGAENESARSVNQKILHEEIDKALGQKPTKTFFEQEPKEPTYKFANDFDIQKVKPKHTAYDFAPDVATAPIEVIQETELARMQRERLEALTENFSSQFAAMQTFNPYQANQTYSLDDLFFNRASAAELNEEQMAQMAAMERGEFYQPEMPQMEDWSAQIEDFATQMSETLASAFDGVGEYFSEFSAQVSESLSSTFEGVGEIFSNLGTQITENLSSSLENVTTAFSATKETVCAAWGEVPAFFSGVFSGLGGAAEAAGSAIFAGLTSPIGAVISAWEGAAAHISSVISSISAQASAMPSSVPHHAEGGLITSPELALIGEAGNELILPLEDPQRSRELLARYGGNIFGGEESAPSTNTVANNNEVAPVVNVTFNVSGENAQDIYTTIRENLSDLTELIAAQMNAQIFSAFNNRPLVG